jgi:hypothetical protein
MNTKTGKTYWAKIYLSGPLDVIEQTCRKECLDAGLCVTVDPTRFIYTGGEETGAVVGLVNYPRFPAEAGAIDERARKLSVRLLDATFQHSALVMSPEKTEWVTKREV